MEATFVQRHGRRPTFVALKGYDAVLAATQAALLAGEPDPDALCNEWLADMNTVQPESTSFAKPRPSSIRAARGCPA